jgi:predicted O-methyltransferase YrrM
MISLVTGASPQEVRAYFAELSEDRELAEHIVNDARAGPYRAFCDPRADFGRRMGWYAIARSTKPRVVVETGVDKGLGSVVLAAALLRNGAGRLYCTELKKGKGHLLSGRYARVGEILFGDSIESLSGFPHKIDLFVSDSDHSCDYECREYRAVAGKLSNHGIIVADNAHVTDCALQFSEATGRRFIFWREQPEKHWYRGGGIGLSYPASP